MNAVDADCSAIRRQILIDPRALTAIQRKHLAECSACSPELTRVERLNAELTRVIQFDPSAAFPQRLLLAQRIRSRRRWQRWAAAASLAVLGFGAVQLWIADQNRHFKNWDQAMVAHMIDDPQQDLRPDPDAASNFAQALVEIGGRPQQALPMVVRAGLCVMHGQVAAHVVFQTGGQRAVAFLMPRSSNPTTMAFDGWSGKMQATRDGGTVAVFTRDASLTEQLSSELAEGLELPAKLM